MCAHIDEMNTAPDGGQVMLIDKQTNTVGVPTDSKVPPLGWRAVVNKCIENMKIK